MVFIIIAALLNAQFPIAINSIVDSGKCVVVESDQTIEFPVEEAPEEPVSVENIYKLGEFIIDYSDFFNLFVATCHSEKIRLADHFSLPEIIISVPTPPPNC